MCHRDWVAWQVSNLGFMSCIFSWPGFVIDYMTIDLMHCGCLGINLYLLGSVIWERFHLMKGKVTKPQQTLTDICRYIKIAAKEIGQEAADQRPCDRHVVFWRWKGSAPHQIESGRVTPPAPLHQLVVTELVESIQPI